MPAPRRQRAARGGDLVEHLMVLRVQLGERDAYTGLFERYNGRLLYYLRRLVEPASEAEDVLQEVWLTVIRKVPSLERPEAFKAWIYRIAHNRALSKMRRKRRDLPLEELPQETEPETSADTEDDTGSFAVYDAAALHRGLERLSLAHREALTLRFIEELSYGEIAEVQGRTIGTVRSRIHYAKKALHEVLAREARNEDQERGRP